MERAENSLKGWALLKQLWRLWLAGGESGSGNPHEQRPDLRRGKGTQIVIRPVDVAKALNRRHKEPLMVTERGTTRNIYTLSIGDLVAIYGDIAREQDDIYRAEDARIPHPARENL